MLIYISDLCHPRGVDVVSRVVQASVAGWYSVKSTWSSQGPYRNYQIIHVHVSRPLITLDPPIQT